MSSLSYQYASAQNFSFCGRKRLVMPGSVSSCSSSISAQLRNRITR